MKVSSTRIHANLGRPKAIKFVDDVIVKESKSKIEIRDKKSNRVLRILRSPAKRSRLGNARIRKAVKEVVRSLGE